MRHREWDMVASFNRFAVYYTPPEDSELARAGAAWLGWDCARGKAVPHPELGLDLARLTQTPRKYGLHGTLKPPMRLNVAQDEFLDAVETLSQTLAPVDLGKLRLRPIGSFLAIVPEVQPSALDMLAAKVLHDIDPFRKALTPAEIHRRRAAGLSARQDALLLEWGYPYVLEEFRFHLTLTGRLDASRMQDAFRSADAWFGPSLTTRYTLADLVVCGEDDMGRFHQVRRFALTG